MQTGIPTFADVCEARDRIESYVVETALVQSPLLAKETGANMVCLKREDTQKNNSFKIRGMANRFLDLPQGQRVVIASCGNAGLSSAALGQQMNIPVCVVAPSYTSRAKAHSILAVNGSILRWPGDYDDSAVKADQMQELGWTTIHESEDPRIIAGHGTIALELFQDGCFPDIIISAAGGGALLAALTLTAKVINPDVRVIGVQSEVSQPWYQSMKAGRIVPVTYGDSIADGLIGGISPLCFDIVHSMSDKEDIVLVTEKDIAQAMRWLFDHHGIMVEGSAATVVAALRAKRVDVRGKNVAVILSGGNIDPTDFAAAINS